MEIRIVGQITNRNFGVTTILIIDHEENLFPTWLNNLPLIQRALNTSNFIFNPMNLFEIRFISNSEGIRRRLSPESKTSVALDEIIDIMEYYNYDSNRHFDMICDGFTYNFHHGFRFETKEEMISAIRCSLYNNCNNFSSPIIYTNVGSATHNEPLRIMRPGDVMTVHGDRLHLLCCLNLIEPLGPFFDRITSVNLE